MISPAGNYVAGYIYPGAALTATLSEPDGFQKPELDRAAYGVEIRHGSAGVYLGQTRDYTYGQSNPRLRPRVPVEAEA